MSIHTPPDEMSAVTAERAGVRASRRTVRDRPQRDNRLLLTQYRQTSDYVYREELIDRFLPLARALALRYRRGAEPLDDLVQVASIGLLKAIDRFDPGRGTEFTSYAVPTIVGELKRHFRDKGWSVRVPRALHDLALRVDRAGEELSGQLGRPPTAPELAERLQVTIEQVVDAREASSARYAVSLDRPRDEGEDGESLADAMGAEDPGYGRAEDAATAERMMAAVLSDRERELLHLRFDCDLTQSAIGARLGISQMHVSRLLRTALARLSDAGRRAEALD